MTRQRSGAQHGSESRVGRSPRHSRRRSTKGSQEGRTVIGELLPVSVLGAALEPLAEPLVKCLDALTRDLVSGGHVGGCRADVESEDEVWVWLERRDGHFVMC